MTFLLEENHVLTTVTLVTFLLVTTLTTLLRMLVVLVLMRLLNVVVLTVTTTVAAQPRGSALCGGTLARVLGFPIYCDTHVRSAFAFRRTTFCEISIFFMPLSSLMLIEAASEETVS